MCQLRPQNEEQVIMWGFKGRMLQSLRDGGGGDLVPPGSSHIQTLRGCVKWSGRPAALGHGLCRPRRSLDFVPGVTGE